MNEKIRIYVAHEHSDLLNAFDSVASVTEHPTSNDQLELPPSYAEVPPRLRELDAEVMHWRARALKAEAKLQVIEARLETFSERLAATQAHLELVFASRSWRLTGPLRFFARQLSLLRRHGVRARTRAFAAKILRSLIHRGASFFAAHSRLRGVCAAGLKRFGLYNLACNAYLHFSKRHSELGVLTQAWQPANLEHLPMRTQAIYYDLRRQIVRRDLQLKSEAFSPER